MVIDKGKLIALLVEKTGRSKQDVEDHLAQLTAKIREVSSTGEEFEIPGFGTFKKQDDSIQFEPTDQLKTEINQKYTGMKPIELMAAFKDTGAGIPVEEASQELPPEKKQPKKKPAAKKKEEKETEPAAAQEVNKKKKAPVAAPVSSSKKNKSTTKVSKKKKSAPKQKTAAGDSDPLGRALIAAVLVIAVLVGGWLLYDSGILSTSTGSENVVETRQDSTTQIADQSVATAVEDSNTATSVAADTAEQNTGNDVSKNREVAQETSSARYGLKGERQPEGDDGYTIVIHSFRLRSSIQEIADSLQQQGYRTLLMPTTVNGESWWRLSLGQFSTIPGAQEAAQQLSSPYKEDHFIKRIQ